MFEDEDENKRIRLEKNKPKSKAKTTDLAKKRKAQHTVSKEDVKDNAPMRAKPGASEDKVKKKRKVKKNKKTDETHVMTDARLKGLEKARKGKKRKSLIRELENEGFVISKRDEIKDEEASRALRVDHQDDPRRALDRSVPEEKGWMEKMDQDDAEPDDYVDPVSGASSEDPNRYMDRLTKIEMLLEDINVRNVDLGRNQTVPTPVGLTQNVASYNQLQQQTDTLHHPEFDDGLHLPDTFFKALPINLPIKSRGHGVLPNKNPKMGKAFQFG